MKINILAEVVWRFTNNGRPSATAQTLSKQDVLQYCLMTFGNILRARFYEEQKLGEEGDPYSAFSMDLQSREFDLAEEDCRGYRYADMSKSSVFVLPKNAHIRNVYAVGEKTCSCGNQEISQVKPGEESFYTDAEYSDFQFFVVKGQGLLTRNLPICAKKLSVDSIFQDKDMDISYDLAFDIANAVLGVSLKVKGWPVVPNSNPYSEGEIELRKSLQEQTGK